MLAIATVVSQVVWMLSPGSLRVSGVALLGLFTVFIAWSMMRRLEVLAHERLIDGRTLCGATAGYLLFGISCGLLLTMLDTEFPGGLYDSSSHQVLTMPEASHLGQARISWD